LLFLLTGRCNIEHREGLASFSPFFSSLLSHPSSSFFFNRNWGA
jgi:hypothetical protein